VLLIPLAQSSTMPARSARACAELRRRTHRSSVARSSALTFNSAMGRPVRIYDRLHILDEPGLYLFIELQLQDTSYRTLRCELPV
jgi:hypothetical protein